MKNQRNVNEVGRSPASETDAGPASNREEYSERRLDLTFNSGDAAWRIVCIVLASSVALSCCGGWLSLVGFAVPVALIIAVALGGWNER